MKPENDSTHHCVSEDEKGGKRLGERWIRVMGSNIYNRRRFNFEL